MDFGIYAAGLPFNLDKERLIRIVDTIDISDRSFKTKWLDLPNIPVGTHLGDILVFSNACYVKYGDFEEKFYRNPNGELVFEGIQSIAPPQIRIRQNKYQILICGHLPAQIDHWLYDDRLEKARWFENPQYAPENAQYPIQEVNIKLKIGVVIRSIPSYLIPKYGIATYSSQGECIYCSGINSIVNVNRIIPLDLPSFCIQSDVSPADFYRKTKIVNKWLTADEYVLLNTIGHEDSSYSSWGGGGRVDYRAGIISIGVGAGGRIISRYSNLFGSYAKRKWTSSRYANGIYENVQFTNPYALTIKIT
ncbi:hypothetical protein [Avibacterium sp. 21-599]|uniref:hypothetical protein n=1 Tax=Avibacterium sp. 21-599 TaxID=2911528 RepID=UPI00224858BC|nr:hypothetical protein [Avibacterium sp. 21-599]MCW9717321.1 hypothetical protein [Avibacterium sp. 21-599]